MVIIDSIKNFKGIEKSIITMGNFDGQHLAHQNVFNILLKKSKTHQLPSVIITFEKHTKFITSKTNVEFLLSTRQEKISFFNAIGIDYLVFLQLENIIDYTAEQYIADVLIHYFHPQIIIVGKNHCFGKQQSGNSILLQSLEKKYNYKTIVIDDCMINNTVVSSSIIRQKITSYDVDATTLFLNKYYYFSGIVVKGNQIGRTINFPTANLNIEDKQKLIPANGVYAVYVKVKHQPYLFCGMMNIGVRPTINNTLSRVIEVHIFNFNQNIYDDMCTIFIVKFIRQEQKFKNIDELKNQLQNDKKISVIILIRLCLSILFYKYYNNL